ncbi:hypothetical protein G4V62_13755 [Bacillaceae bacterium SIJ1]|uniref:baseplate J/gp47 family protein n=1 Tax=Litoribacterium kuwaitense TaxID=1398745 RepID=UPI0013ED743F|nr:baseplate J/gp47 family protein [Litoribacterium kuwaitense]NGP45959.1 hypothetical protein [Litoribacterium kuwaitense]
MFGLTKDGFKRKRYVDIRAELSSEWKRLFGENSSTESGINGKLISLIAFGLSGVWKLAEKVYNGGFVHKATGRTLDGLVDNRLMRRRPAEKAKGLIEVTGDEGTLIESGFIVSNGKQTYETTENATISGAGTVEIPVIAQLAGSDSNTEANTVTDIVTPLVGVSDVVNPDPISGGRDEETDEELKERYDQSHSTGNSPSTNGIRAEVLGVEGVRTATVAENLSLETDQSGRPGRSFEVFVIGGEDNDIAKAIFRRRAAGIQPYGQITIDIVDDSGNIVPVGFSRAEEVYIYFNVQVETDNEFPADGYEQVRTAIIQYVGGTDYDGNVYTGLTAGQDMIFTMVVYEIHKITGVTSIPVLEIGTDPDNLLPMNTIEINPTQVAMTDYEKVTVS